MLRVQQFRYRFLTPSPRPSPWLARAAACIAWAFFSFLVATIGSHLVSEACDLRFCQPFRDDHLNKVVFCQREVRQPGVVYLGSSQIHNGVIPAVVAQGAAERGLQLDPGYNLGIGSTGLEIAFIVARDVLQEEQQPKIVVLGVCPLLLIAETADTPRNLCLFGSWGDVTRHVARRELRPASLLDVTFRGPKNLVGFPLRSWGEPQARWYRTKHLRKSQGSRWLPEEIKDARVAPPDAWAEQVRALPPLPKATFRDSSRAAQTLIWFRELSAQRGWKLVLVDPPQHPDLHRRQLPAGTEEAYQTWLSDFCRRHGLAHFDLTEPDLYEHDDFGDPVHLNAKGAGKFSRRLGEVLAKKLHQPEAPGEEGESPSLGASGW